VTPTAPADDPAAPGGNDSTDTKSLPLAVAANGAEDRLAGREVAEPPAVVATKSASVVAIIAVGSIVPGVGTSAGASAARIAATQGLGTCGRVEPPAYYALPMPEIAPLFADDSSIAEAVTWRALACAVVSVVLCVAAVRMLPAGAPPEVDEVRAPSTSAGLAQAVVSVVPAYVTPGVAEATLMIVSAAVQPDLASRAADDGAAPAGSSGVVAVAALAMPAVLLAAWLHQCLRHYQNRHVEPPPPPATSSSAGGAVGAEALLLSTSGGETAHHAALPAVLLIAPPREREAAGHPLRFFNFFVETSSAVVVAAAAGVVVESASALCVLRALVAVAVSVAFTAYVALLRPLRTDPGADPLEHVFQLAAAAILTVEALLMLAAVAADWQGSQDGFTALRDAGEHGTLAALAVFALGAVVLAVRTCTRSMSSGVSTHAMPPHKATDAANTAGDHGQPRAADGSGGSADPDSGALLQVPSIVHNPLRQTAAKQRR
jgi:hypothetical protein